MDAKLYAMKKSMDHWRNQREIFKNHVNVWQNPLQYCKIISLQLIKKKEKIYNTWRQMNKQKSNPKSMGGTKSTLRLYSGGEE